MNEYDFHQQAYALIEKIEHTYHDRKGIIRGLEINLFDTPEIHVVEAALREAFEYGKNTKKRPGSG